MQSAKLLEPPSPKLLPTRPQFIRGRYALHLIIAQDRKASSLIHANRSHRFGSVFGLWLACIDVTKPFAKADHSIFRQRSAPPNMVAAVSQLLLKRVSVSGKRSHRTTSPLWRPLDDYACIVPKVKSSAINAIATAVLCQLSNSVARHRTTKRAINRTRPRPPGIPDKKKRDLECQSKFVSST
jgi:hypothetical protein